LPLGYLAYDRFRLGQPLLHATAGRASDVLHDIPAHLETALAATDALTEGTASRAGPAGVLAGGVLAIRRAPFPVVVIVAMLRLCGLP
jgi:hypothetical protein